MVGSVEEYVMRRLLWLVRADAPEVTYVEVSGELVGMAGDLLVARVEGGEVAEAAAVVVMDVEVVVRVLLWWSM